LARWCGEWGYVTQLVQLDDLDLARWKFFILKGCAANRKAATQKKNANPKGSQC